MAISNYFMFWQIQTTTVLYDLLAPYLGLAGSFRKNQNNCQNVKFVMRLC